MFSGPMPPGRVTSVEATYLNSPGRGVSFLLPHRTAMSTAYRRAVKMSIAADQPIPFLGTTAASSTAVKDAVLPRSAVGQRLTLAPGAEIFPQPVEIEAERWVAWLYLYRHIAGSVPTVSLTGSSGLTMETPLASRDWCTLGGMTEVPARTPSISFWHRCAGASATLHIGGMNLLAFNTRQEARDFLNSGLFAA
jgi:hypothetical protein